LITFLPSGRIRRKRRENNLSKDQKILKEISHKLDQLIILTKLNSLDIIKQYKAKIRRDKISAKILDYSDASLSYSKLVEKVSKELGVAEITVMKKISELKEMGFLVTERKGREVYYDKSGLFE
jgi:DNA-binding transcriptional ArsR family regulator